MSQAYSDPARANDKFALPDVEIFELTAAECVDADTIEEYMRLPAFRLASMNRRVYEQMIDAIVEEQGVKGGWFYWYCFPGCMPEGDPVGPYETYQEAFDAMRDDATF